MSQDDRPAWWARASDPWAPPADSGVRRAPPDAPSGVAGAAAGGQQPADLRPVRRSRVPEAADVHPTEVLGNPAGPPAGRRASVYGAPPAYGASRSTARLATAPRSTARPAYGADRAGLRRARRTAPPLRASRTASAGGRAQLDTLGRPQKPPRRPPGWAALDRRRGSGRPGGRAARRLHRRRGHGRPARPRARSRSGTTPPGDLSRPADSVAGIADRVLPTVVSIEVRSGSTGGTGSGFVLTADGYLLTNNHVVAAAGDNGTITVTFNDGSKEKAEVVGRTVTYDLAVIKVDRTGLPVAELGNSDAVVVGDAAIAVGSPLGLSGTVTSGIISAVDRPVTAGEGNGSDVSYIAALQTDAAINPGQLRRPAGRLGRTRHRREQRHRDPRCRRRGADRLDRPGVLDPHQPGASHGGTAHPRRQGVLPDHRRQPRPDLHRRRRADRHRGTERRPRGDARGTGRPGGHRARRRHHLLRRPPRVSDRTS